MGVRLVVAEKPSMGKAIAAALGLTGGGKDCIKGKDIWVTWCVGHLIELAEPEAYGEQYKRWNWSGLPCLPETYKYEVSPKTKSQYAVVKALLNDPQVTEVVNAGDAGREGELIVHLVYAQAKCKKPMLRFWTGSLTDGEIKKAWAQLFPDSQKAGLLDAARCRQESDWLIGMNGTRAQTLYMRVIKPVVGRVPPFSVGRVQTPVLALLYNQHMAIKNFVPRNFWTVEGVFQAQAGAYRGQWFTRKGGKFVNQFDKETEAKAVVDRVQGKPGRIESFIQKDVEEASDLLYDLTALQKEANKRFGFTAEHTLEVLQTLYEGKYVTYPRTGSRYLTESDAAELPSKLKAVGKLPEYAPFVQGADLGKRLAKRYVDASKVEDHHAIIPTEQPPTGGLSPEQQNLYDLIVRRTLAAFYPPMILGKTEIITEVTAEDKFKTNGSIVKDPGWSKVDPRGRMVEEEGPGEEAEGEAGMLPPVHQGDAVSTKEAKTKAGKTKPPKPFTDGDLLEAMSTAGKFVEDEEMKAAMKDCGLGTPATRGSIIETLVKRQYIERKRKAFQITERGIELIENIPFEVLKSPSLTGDWEAKLAKMERGEYNRSKFMAEITAFTRDYIEQTRAKCGGKADDPGAGGGGASDATTSCPGCGKETKVSHWQDGNHSAKCDACAKSWATDANGKALGECRSCKKPWKVIKSGSKLCEWCNTWQDPKGGGGINGGSDFIPKVLMDCPKCKAGKVWLRIWEGKHYARCDNKAGDCKLSYDTDSTGKPSAGVCKSCGAPVGVTKTTRTRICVACNAFQDPKPEGAGGAAPANPNRPAPPPKAKCPHCSGDLRSPWTKNQEYAYRCDPCNKWWKADKAPSK